MVFCQTGLGRLAQAEEYLAQAEWTVLKTPDVSLAMKSRLHRNLGLLSAAKGDFPEALRHLADDVRLVKPFAYIAVYHLNGNSLVDTVHLADDVRLAKHLHI